MGKCHGGTQSGQVDHIFLFIYRILVGGVFHRRTLEPAVTVGPGHVVHWENAVFRSGLNGHVGDAEPVVDGKILKAVAGELHGLIQGAIHADHPDDMQDHVLAADPLGGLAGKSEFQGAGHLKPGLAGHHARAHIGRPYAGREGPQRAVGAGMGIRADHQAAGAHQALLRQKGMLDAHAPHVKIV